MHSVLQLSKRLASPPSTVAIPGVHLRTYNGPGDIDTWLELRHRAFARQTVGVRQWTADDFRAEFLEKWWWQPERMWFAEAETMVGRQIAGTITLAMRGEEREAKPVIHWLAVLPAWRRRGIARLLVNALEAAAWAAGYRDVYLETHVAWTAAAALYARLGYRPDQ